MTIEQTEPTRDTGLGVPVPQSADPIDRVVNLAPKWTLFALGACGLLVATIIVWSFAGTVTSSVDVPGLYNQNGSVRITSPTQATVDKVLVSTGDTVEEGQPIVSLTSGEDLYTPQAGVVSQVLVSPGSVMYADKAAAVVTDTTTPDTVAVLIPASLTGQVRVGLPVRMSVPGAPPSQFGYLLGTVDEVSSGPYTLDQVSDIMVLEEQVVASVFGTAPGLLAIIKLDVEQDNPSGYAWSVGSGPPFVVAQGTPIAASVILSERHPIEVVFPALSEGSSA